jgi:hypothetical protein
MLELKNTPARLTFDAEHTMSNSIKDKMIWTQKRI